MITDIKDAIKIVLKELPNLKIYNCIDTKKYFKFSMVTKNNELLGNSSVFVVRKNSGKFGWVNVVNISDTLMGFNFFMDPIINEYSQKEIETIISKNTL